VIKDWSYSRALLGTFLHYLEIRFDSSMTLGGEGERNRVTWDELSVLPFWQTLPYRFYLKSWEVSDRRKETRRQ
jgi:hypothetical protein